MEDNRNKQIIQQVFETSLSGIEEDPRLAQRVLNKAHEAQGMGGALVRRKWSVGLVLVILIVMSSLVALACNHSYVIQYLFGRNMDSDDAQLAQTKVQLIDYEQKSDTSVCTVKDAYFDGETLAIGVGFKTDRPLYLVSEETKIDGEWIEWVEASGSMEERFLGNVASPQRFDEMEEITGVKYLLSRPLPKGKEVEVTMKITMLTPREGVEEVDVWQEDKENMWAQIDAIRDRGWTPISGPGPHNEWHMALISQTPTGNSHAACAYHGPYGDVEALIEYANMEVVDVVELTFRLKTQ